MRVYGPLVYVLLPVACRKMTDGVVLLARVYVFCLAKIKLFPLFSQPLDNIPADVAHEKARFQNVVQNVNKPLSVRTVQSEYKGKLSE